MSKIKDFLKAASKAYYEGDPIISDEQYDALEEVYGELEKPGYNPDKGVPHFYPMYSLKKYYLGEDDLPDWIEGKNYVVTPKVDGSAIAALYVDGCLTQVLTRGDGTKGLDITHLPFVEKGLLPKEIVDAPNILQVTGEIAAPSSIPNARNYASGALGLKDPKEFLNRNLLFFAYDCYPNIEPFYDKNLDALFELEFTLVSDSSLELVPKDGEVYRINNYDCFYKLGYTSKHPRGAFALKYRTEGIPTKLLDVVWQTGKSGKVTPVAILAPIVIDGATVTRATLNNVGFIEALDIEIGDYVMVERSGGIIPRIIKKAELKQINENLSKNNS